MKSKRYVFSAFIAVCVLATSVAFADVVEEKDQCKDGGWAEVVDAEGNEFKNQGQCVAYLMPAQEDDGGPTPTSN